VPGQRDDRNRRRSLVRLQPARRLPAVHDRQRQIHQDDIGLLIDGPLQRLLAVLRFDDVEPRILQVLRVHLARVRIIVDDEHTRPLILVGHFRPLIGSVRVNVEPLPT